MTKNEEASYLSPQNAVARSGGPAGTKRPFVFFPVWWWIYLVFFVTLSFVVSLVENAASQIMLNVTILLGILLLLLNWFRRGSASFWLRAAPLIAFIGFLGLAAAAIRVDDMSGNLVPTRVSFRWQPQPDELLMQPQQTVPQEGGVDLLTTTEQDFPEFLGPARGNRVDVALSTDWELNPPKLIWHKEEFGAGWSGFVAVNGYAITMEQRGENELVTCYEIESGDLQWAHAEVARHQTVPGGVGPRSTPTIAEGKVYTLGATGILLCLDGSDGHIIWKKNLLDLIGTTPAEDSELVQWGRSASPLVDGGRVIVPLGISKIAGGDRKAGASLIAFDTATGDELWRKGDHQVSYSSPTLMKFGGLRQIVVVCESEICGHDATTGEQLWEFAWPGNSAANASCSQPIQVSDDRLFVSKGYAHGASLLGVTQVGSEWRVEEIWHKLTVMKTKFTNPVLHDGYVYGLDDSILSCVDVETGDRQWKRGRYGHGQTLQAGDQLLVQAESGEVALVALDPDRFTELGRFEPISGKTWNNPCLYGNFLLTRNGQQAACYLLP